MTHRDSFTVFTASLLIFAAAAFFAGKPLSVHEARLPVLARHTAGVVDAATPEAPSRWLVPASGDAVPRPWLERPPLPQGVVLLTSAPFGGPTSVPAVRLGSVLAGAITCLLTAATVARLTDRRTGLTAGLLLATTFAFHTYATLAEDDIDLAALVAAGAYAAVRAELSRSPAWLIGCFALLGLANLTKGPLIGTAQVGVGVGAYVLIRAVTGDRSSLLWWLKWLVPGLTMYLIVALPWPVYAARTVPSAVENWRYDLFGPFGGKPPGYYLLRLPVALLPWTPLAAVGVWALTRRTPAGRAVLADRRSLLLLCLAIAPVVLMSLPSRKHHHYLLPILWGWAGLAATGWGVWAADRRGGWRGLGVGVALTAAGLWAYQALAWGWASTRGREARFATVAASVVPADAPLVVVATDTLEFFAVQWYASERRPERRPRKPPLVDVLHNETYARATPYFERAMAYAAAAGLDRPTLYLLTPARSVAYLNDQIGEATVLARADFVRGHDEEGESDARRWTLVRLTYDADFAPSPPKPVDVLQGLGRRNGPWVGDPPAYLVRSGPGVWE